MPSVSSTETEARRTNGQQRDIYITECSDESDIEECEPVQAQLVLKILATDQNGITPVQVKDQFTSPAPSPAASRKTSSNSPRDSFYLQRSPSQSSFDGRGGLLSFDDPNQLVRKRSTYSRDGSISPVSHQSFELELPKPDGVNSVDFMSTVTKQTKVLESGLRELRNEINNPMRVIDLGQEAIVLSGLNQRAGDSLKHIKNLYEETKYLKTYLDKMEAKVHYDIAMTRKTPKSPGWFRRLAFLGGVAALCTYAYSQRYPEDFEVKLAEAIVWSEKAKEAAVGFVQDYLSGSGRLQSVTVVSE